MLAGKEGGGHKLLRIFHRWMRVGKGETLQSCILHLARMGKGKGEGFLKKTRVTFSSGRSFGFVELYSKLRRVFDRATVKSK